MGTLLLNIKKITLIPQASEIGFYKMGFCRFEGWSDRVTPRGIQTRKACNDLCFNDGNCIAYDVASPKGDNTFDCNTYHGSGNYFHTECETNKDDLRCDTRCFKKNSKLS